MGGRFDEDWYANHQAKVRGQREAAVPAPTRLVDRDAEAARQQSKPELRQKRTYPETDLQKAVAKFLDTCLAPPARWFHTPNEAGTRDNWEIGHLSAMGVKPGIADVLILKPDRTFVWIELKAPKGSLSEGQKDWKAWCLSIGAPWFLCRSIEEVIAACGEAGVQLRGRLA